MHKQAKTELSCRNDDKYTPWFLLRRWWPSSLMDMGLPVFMEPREHRWTEAENLYRSLSLCLWPSPMFLPYISDSTHHSGQNKWRVFLDVAHFLPSEISLSITDGFLRVEGRHEEKADEHGFITRCFTRKYRLPDEVDPKKIRSTLSVDGFLTVEAPVPATCSPHTFIIPIKVEMDNNGDQKAQEADAQARAGRGENVQPSDSATGIELQIEKEASKNRTEEVFQPEEKGTRPESEDLKQEETK